MECGIWVKRKEAEGRVKDEEWNNVEEGKWKSKNRGWKMETNYFVTMTGGGLT